MFTGRMDEQIPVVIFGKKAGEFMQQIPAKEIKILGILWPVDCQGKISTTLGGTIITQDLILFELATFDLSGESVHE